VQRAGKVQEQKVAIERKPIQGVGKGDIKDQKAKSMEIMVGRDVE